MALRSLDDLFYANAEIFPQMAGKRTGEKDISNEKVYGMSFSKIYPLLVSKAEKKGRTLEAFADRLQGYKTSKGTIQLPYNKPLPIDLISEIAVWCGKEYGK